jgi:hypothetical protein
MLKNLIKIKKINKNMKKFVDTQIYFFENILMEISNKKSIKKIDNKYMGISFSYGIVGLNNYNNRISNSRISKRGEYKLIKNNNILFDLDKLKIDKNKNKKNVNNINE